MAKWYENVGIGFLEGTKERLARERLEKREDEKAAATLKMRKLEIAEADNKATKRWKQEYDMKKLSIEEATERDIIHNKNVLDRMDTNANIALDRMDTNAKIALDEDRQRFKKLQNGKNDKTKENDEIARAKGFLDSKAELPGMFKKEIEARTLILPEGEELSSSEKKRIYNKMQMDALESYYPEKAAKLKQPELTPDYVREYKAKFDKLPKTKIAKELKRLKDGDTYWHYNLYLKLVEMDKSESEDEKPKRIYHAKGLGGYPPTPEQAAREQTIRDNKFPSAQPNYNSLTGGVGWGAPSPPEHAAREMISKEMF